MTTKEILNTMQKCLDEIRHRETLETNQEGWVCKHCGKSTFEVDYDYLVDADEHLGCALEKEQEAQKKMDKMVSKHPQIKHPEWLI